MRSATAASSRRSVSVSAPSWVSARRSVSATVPAPSIVKIGSILCASAFTPAASSASRALHNAVQFAAVCSAKEARIDCAASASSPA